MKKVVLGIVLINQLVSGMDLPTSSSGEQERRSNLRETTIAQLSINDLQDMIRDSVKMAVIANTQEFREAVNEVSSQLKEALDQRINFQAMNFKKVLERKEGEHRREMEAKDAQLKEMRNEKIRIEREEELKDLINGVYRSNPDDEFIRSHSFISGNAQEMKGIEDFFTRRNQVEDIYNKVKLFSDLFGREDLGVNAKQDDLTKVSEYLNDTKVSPKPAEPTLIRDAFWTPKLAKGLFPSSLPIFPDEGFIRGKYGLTHILAAGGGLLGHYEERMTVDWYNRCKNIENTERKNAHKKAMSNWNAEVSRASAVSLPSEEFDRLIKQCNDFIKKTIICQKRRSACERTLWLGIRQAQVVRR